MKCRICFDKLDPEHPSSIYGLNPITFRKGWMHYDCCTQAYYELSYMRKDEYNQHEDK